MEIVSAVHFNRYEILSILFYLFQAYANNNGQASNAQTSGITYS